LKDLNAEIGRNAAEFAEKIVEHANFSALSAAFLSDLRD